MKKRVLAALFAGVMAISLCACESDAGSTDSDTMTDTQQQPEEETTYGIGDTWTVDGQWELTITGVTETNDRNEFSERTPAAVYLVDYEYTNIGYEDESGIMNGLYIAIDDSIVDAGSNMGYSYPGNITSYPQETPVGATCTAQACIGVDNSGSFTLRVSQYDGSGTLQEATFEVAVK